jgi:hypothetical protein
MFPERPGMRVSELCGDGLNVSGTIQHAGSPDEAKSAEREVKKPVRMQKLETSELAQCFLLLSAWDIRLLIVQLLNADSY